MTRLLFVLTAFAIWLTPPLSSRTLLVATAQQTNDQDLLKGSWQPIKREVQGKVNKGPFREDTWVFNVNQLTLLRGDKEFAKFKFVLDPTKKPKTIKMTLTDGLEKPKIIFGIYQIEGDTLKLTQSLDDFPKEFGGPGKKTGLVTFRRMKR